MAQQEEGWPLGLQPVNERARLARNGDFSGSISFNTMLTGSPSSSTDSSSGFDTESTGSFFHEKSITLGSLIGVSNILVSRRSVMGKRAESLRLRKSSYRSKAWFLSLCSKIGTEKNPPSLGHFLEAERKAAKDYRTSPIPMIYELNNLGETQPVSEHNFLFINDSIAPSQSSSLWFGSYVKGRCKKVSGRSNGCGVPVFISRMCGQSTN